MNNKYVAVTQDISGLEVPSQLRWSWDRGFTHNPFWVKFILHHTGTCLQQAASSTPTAVISDLNNFFSLSISL